MATKERITIGAQESQALAIESRMLRLLIQTRFLSQKQAIRGGSLDAFGDSEDQFLSWKGHRETGTWFILPQVAFPTGQREGDTSWEASGVDLLVKRQD
jgi:hypothetical protein